MRSTAFILLLCLTACLNVNAQSKMPDDSARKVKELLGTPIYTSSSNDDARKFYQLGGLSYEKGDARAAIKYYRKAIHLDSNFVDALDNCGLAYRHLGILDSAEFCFKRSLQVMPKGKLAHIDLALVYEIENKYSEAYDLFAQCVDIDPDYAEGYYGEARILLALNRADKAIPAAEKALQLYKKQSPDLVGDGEAVLGMAYYYSGNKSQAKKHLSKAIDLGSKKGIPENILDDLGMN